MPVNKKEAETINMLVDRISTLTRILSLHQQMFDSLPQLVRRNLALLPPQFVDAFTSYEQTCIAYVEVSPATYVAPEWEEVE